MGNCLITSLHFHGSVTSVTICVIIFTNEYTSLDNAHYYVLFCRFQAPEWKVNGLEYFMRLLGHYGKGHLSNSLWGLIIAKRFRNAANTPRMLLELAGFATKASRRQTVEKQFVVWLPASAVHVWVRWNVAQWCLQGFEKWHRRYYVL